MVSSRERKPRHQSGAGNAACGLPEASRYFGGTSTTAPVGKVSVVRMQPESHGANASAAAHRTARLAALVCICAIAFGFNSQRVAVAGRDGGQSASLLRPSADIALAPVSRISCMI